MPLVATLALNFVLGALASLAAARELRASPRAILHARGFHALLLHECLVAMPVAAYLLIRFGDWSVSYVTDGARLPSALVLLLIALHGALAAGGFALGARLLRDHRARWVLGLAGGTVGALAVAALVGRHRLTVAGTYVQYRGGFGLTPLWSTAVFSVALALGLAWLAAATHLLWSLRRKL